MKASIVEMEGLLRGKCVPAKMLVNESLAEYLVRQFDAIHERADKAERERDELITQLSVATERVGINFERAKAAEAELARRDAAAGEPFAYIDSAHIDEFGWGYAFKHSSPIRMACESPVYAVAQPAVLPPEKPVVFGSDLCQDIENYGYNLALADTRQMGAQQQNFVELPDRKFRECVNGLLEEAISYAGTQQLRARLSSRLSNFVKPQRVENVKWEVKK